MNLQEHYSEIYFVSPHWNPAIEDQAVARCHRIGQKKTVEVYRFVMTSFYEKEDVFSIKREKKESMNNSDSHISSLSLDGYVSCVQDKKRLEFLPFTSV